MQGNNIPFPKRQMVLMNQTHTDSKRLVTGDITPNKDCCWKPQVLWFFVSQHIRAWLPNEGVALESNPFLDTSCHISPVHQIPEKTAETAAFYSELHAVLHSFYMRSHDKPVFPDSPQRAGSQVLSRLSAHSRSSQYPLLRGSITAWGSIWEMSMLRVQAVDYVELNNSLMRAQELNIFLSMFCYFKLCWEYLYLQHKKRW